MNTCLGPTAAATTDVAAGSPVARTRQRGRNLAQAAVLLGAMVTLLAMVAWFVAGLPGVVMAGLLGTIGLTWRPRLPSSWLLRQQGAVPLAPHEAPQLQQLTTSLARRAGLRVAPSLYLVRSPVLTAFAVGDPEDPAIAVTEGLLCRLDARALAGVLAHEVSHIRSNDQWVMALSDTVARVTNSMAWAGLVALFLSVPAGAPTWPLLVSLGLSSLPTVLALLQLGLSRAREYDADLEAVRLTGDPVGLARALALLERDQGHGWERLLSGRTPTPSLFRTHPPTGDRIRRLLEVPINADGDRAFEGGKNPWPAIATGPRSPCVDSCATPLEQRQ